MHLIAAILFIVLAIPIYANAEIETITQTIRQPFGGSQSADDARIAAVTKAKREALEQAGTYVEALTIVKESSLDKDEIIAITAGVCQSEVLSSKNYATDDAFGIEVKVKVLVDTTVLGERVKKLLADRSHLEELNSAKKSEKKLLARIGELEKENLQKGKTVQQIEELKANFKKASQGLVKLAELDMGGKNSQSSGELLKLNPDIDEKTKVLTSAISLDPNNVNAYKERAAIYMVMGKYDLAINDYSQVIHLVPNDYAAYTQRGIAYMYNEQRLLAKSDFDMALKNSNNIDDAKLAYWSRSTIYFGLKDDMRGCHDLKMACDGRECFYRVYSNSQCTDRTGVDRFKIADKVKPNEIVTDNSMVMNVTKHYSDGNTSFDLHQYEQAIDHYSEVIRLDPKHVYSYTNRGLSYGMLKRYGNAIADYDQSIRLDPKDKDTYIMRARAYFMLNKTKEGCSDQLKACALGKCNADEMTVLSFCKQI